jgi:hypothetical protein
MLAYICMAMAVALFVAVTVIDILVIRKKRQYIKLYRGARAYRNRKA